MNVSEVRQKFLAHYSGQGYVQRPAYPLIDPFIPHSFLPSAFFKRWVPEIEENNLDKSMRFQCCVRDTDAKLISTGFHLSLFEMAAVVKRCTPESMEAEWGGFVADYLAFITGDMRIDRARLWVTIFGGGEVLGKYRSPDEMSRSLLLGAGFPNEHIVALGVKDNFSALTELEPVGGPRIEIFFDYGSCECDSVCQPGHKKNCSRFMEIGNISFLPYTRVESSGNVMLDAARTPLIGVAVGLERITALVNSERNIMSIPELHDATNVLGITASDGTHKAIDFLRTLGFIIAAGGVPEHGGRGYVVKKFIKEYLIQLSVIGVPFSVTETILLGFLNQYLKFYPNSSARLVAVFKIIDDERNRLGELINKTLLRIDSEPEESHDAITMEKLGVGITQLRKIKAGWDI